MVHQRHLHRTGGRDVGPVHTRRAVSSTPRRSRRRPNVGGTFAFQATYSGDGTYTGSTGPCEPLTVTTIASTTVTVIHDAAHATVTSVPAGTTVHDQATVTRRRLGDTDGDGDVLVVHQRHLHRTGRGDVERVHAGGRCRGRDDVHADARTWPGASRSRRPTPVTPPTPARPAPCEPLTVTTLASTHGDRDPRRRARDGDVGAGGDDGARPGHGDGAGRPAGADRDGDVPVVHQRAFCTGIPAATSSPFTLDGSGVADGTTFTQTPNTVGTFAFQATYSGDGTYTGSTGAVRAVDGDESCVDHGDGDPRRRACDGDVGAGGDDGARPGDGDGPVGLPRRRGR